MEAVTYFATTSGAIVIVRDYVTPTIHTLAALASIACTFFIVNAGYLYMTSGGKPEQMEHAKRVLKNAALGLVIVLAAATLVAILANAYGSPHSTTTATLPNLQAVEPRPASNGLVEVLVNAVVGFLNTIIQAVAAPFLGALDYFTKSTPLMADNQSVFNFWLAMVGIADVLLVIIVALLGFHVMSATAFGFDDIDLKHLLPRVGLVFLVMNTSIFFIDSIIELSNVLIAAVSQISGTTSVWQTLTKVVEQSGSQGLAALLIMLIFLIFSVILLVFYVGRIVILYVGAVLSPLIALVWLVPGFRDFAETAMKTYVTTIFVLFVHVVILQLAASLFVGMSPSSGSDVPNTLMSMIVGLATILALLKTQGVMMQFSYVSMGSRNMRKLSGQFINGVSHMTGKGKAAASTVSSKTASAQKARTLARVESKAVQTGKPQTVTYQNKKGTADITHTARPTPKEKPTDKNPAGTIREAPQVKVTRVSANIPKNISKDKLP